MIYTVIYDDYRPIYCDVDFNIYYIYDWLNGGFNGMSTYLGHVMPNYIHVLAIFHGKIYLIMSGIMHEAVYPFFVIVGVCFAITRASWLHDKQTFTHTLECKGPHFLERSSLCFNKFVKNKSAKWHCGRHTLICKKIVIKKT